MIRQISVEIAKIWSNRVFIISFALVVFINWLMLWGQIVNMAVPASAYHTMQNELSKMNAEEAEIAITEKYAMIDAMATIENAQRGLAAGWLSTEAAKSQYDDIYKKYFDIYNKGEYLVYTDNALSEYTFIKSIYDEFLQVNGHDTFLKSIDEKAEQIRSVSIFAKDNSSFISKNLLKTQEDYANIKNIAIRYSPQKGLYTAVNFLLSDFGALILLVFAAFTTLRYERDKGLLPLIRSTAGGRLKCAIAKMNALIFSALGIVLVIYVGNLMVCHAMLGLGPLTRSIQSNPFLMRSTLQINVLQYLILFVFTKWLALAVIGVWVMFMALLPKKAVVGYSFAITFPVISEVLRRSIAFTDSLNLLRYLNIASLLQTNEILGSYLNLNLMSNPVNILTVELVSGAVYFVILLLLFLYTFCLSSLTLKEGGRKRLYKKIHTSLFSQESYKILIMNGGIFILIFFLGFQIYSAVTQSSNITPQEIYTRNYMDILEGEISNDKIQYLNQEYDRFQPIISLENALASGALPQEVYDTQMIPYAHLSEQYKMFSSIYENTRQHLTAGESCSYIYDSGYPKFWGIGTTKNLVECLLVCVSAALLFASVFAVETSSGMIHVVSVTPLGRRRLLSTKLFVCMILTAMLSCGSLIAKFVVMLRDYSFSAFWLPISSLPEFEQWESSVPIFTIIALFVLVRFIACLGISLFVAVLSSRLQNAVAVTVASVLVLCLPILLTFAKLDVAGYISFYPLFNFMVMLADSEHHTLAWWYLLIAVLWITLALLYLYSRKDLSEVKHRTLESALDL